MWATSIWTALIRSASIWAASIWARAASIRAASIRAASIWAVPIWAASTWAASIWAVSIWAASTWAASIWAASIWVRTMRWGCGAGEQRSCSAQCGTADSTPGLGEQLYNNNRQVRLFPRRGLARGCPLGCPSFAPQYLLFLSVCKVVSVFWRYDDSTPWQGYTVSSSVLKLSGGDSVATEIVTLPRIPCFTNGFLGILRLPEGLPGPARIPDLARFGAPISPRWILPSPWVRGGARFPRSQLTFPDI